MVIGEVVGMVVIKGMWEMQRDGRVENEVATEGKGENEDFWLIDGPRASGRSKN